MACRYEGEKRSSLCVRVGLVAISVGGGCSGECRCRDRCYTASAMLPSLLPLLGLLKLVACIVWMGRIELGETLRPFGWDCIGYCRQIGARLTARVGHTALFFSTWLRSASCSDPKFGAFSQVAATNTLGRMPRPRIERPEGV